MDRCVKRRKVETVAEAVQTAPEPVDEPAGGGAVSAAEVNIAESGGLTLRQGELMHSTNPASVAKRKWLALAPSLERVESRAYCSTDGSSTGWHACVFVAAGATSARLVARHRDHEGSRNVGAEGYGFALGCQTLPKDCLDCVFLADFLNALAFAVGAAKFKHPALVKAYAEVKASRTKKGAWAHVHHPGHQTDDSWYTVLNCCADNLAGRQRDIDIVVPLAVLPKLAAQPQKKKLKVPDVLEAFLGDDDVPDGETCKAMRRVGGGHAMC